MARAAVSKTAGREFEPLLPCHFYIKKSRTAMENKSKKSIMGRIRQFIADTVAEMRRCTWPGRQQLMESTVLVVVATCILALFVAGVDEVARIVIGLVTVGQL